MVISPTELIWLLVDSLQMHFGVLLRQLETGFNGIAESAVLTISLTEGDQVKVLTTEECANPTTATTSG